MYANLLYIYIYLCHATFGTCPIFLVWALIINVDEERVSCICTWEMMGLMANLSLHNAPLVYFMRSH